MLTVALLNNEFHRAVVLAQTFLATASYANIAAEVAAAPVELRERLVLLFRDVLSLAPRRRFGVPVLLLLRDPDRSRVRLPSHIRPPAEWRSYVWREACTTGEAPFVMLSREVIVLTGTVTAACLTLDLDQEAVPEIDDDWWRELMEHSAESAIVLARMVLPWPDALEAACRMLSGARGELPDPALFLSPAAADFAYSAGREFSAQHRAPSQC